MNNNMNAPGQRLAALAPRFAGMRRGIEKESLRVQPDGRLALTPHPAALGAPLTHPRITTDFSEAQLELVTGAHASVQAMLAELEQIHQVVYHELQALGDELLWVSSMPCKLPADETIPIGVYGSSNHGRTKSVYRMGLGHRYGRRMQTISGIHYNWSLPELSNDDYFGLIRNFRRRAFALLYLFGASPAVCRTFVAGREHALIPLGASGVMHLPWATSLRMGRLGYQSQAQAMLAVSYNGLESYAASLEEALTRPYPPYEAIGIRNPGGEYNQLSTTLLQIENEFYGAIRPKRVTRPDERPLHALRERGVEDVEVRLMDLDPFEPLGIGADTARFLDLFLLHCLLEDSPPDTPQEIAAIERNQQAAAARGREPGLKVELHGGQQLLTGAVAALLGQLPPIAQALDAALGGAHYAQALARIGALQQAPQRLPSARVLQTVRQEHGDDFVSFVLAQSRQAQASLMARSCPARLKAEYDALAAQSVSEQTALQAADTQPFESYRRQYVCADRLRVA
ncbi:MAG: glutamate--cysteine ligase [Burkholderiaceae bacterium]|nr:glutamate--cysteine ligase [Burkholderiaceae bacterium]